MSYQDKTRKQLIKELAELHKVLNSLKATIESICNRKRIHLFNIHTAFYD